jgi:hypothetical protein
MSVCADHLEPHPTAPGGSIFTINTGFVDVIGPNQGHVCQDLPTFGLPSSVVAHQNDQQKKFLETDPS